MLHCFNQKTNLSQAGNQAAIQWKSTWQSLLTTGWSWTKTGCCSTRPQQPEVGWFPPRIGEFQPKPGDYSTHGRLAHRLEFNTVGNHRGNQCLTMCETNLTNNGMQFWLAKPTGGIPSLSRQFWSAEPTGVFPPLSQRSAEFQVTLHGCETTVLSWPPAMWRPRCYADPTAFI